MTLTCGCEQECPACRQRRVIERIDFEWHALAQRPALAPVAGEAEQPETDTGQQPGA